MEFSDPNEIKASFENEGGEFISPLSVFTQKLPHINAFVFDWDGVFNSGFKNDISGSPFSEPSSMGINMLRFSGYLKNSNIPHIFIITGENNVAALKLAEREHYTGVYLNVRNKLAALKHIENKFGISASEVAFAFDDILDLGMAEQAALRFLVTRKANPLMAEYILKNNLADYRTGSEGQEHAVREICELIIGLNASYEETIHKRLSFSEEYKNYLEMRNGIETRFYEGSSGKIATYLKM